MPISHERIRQTDYFYAAQIFIPMKNQSSVEEYIATYPESVQLQLEQMRKAIRSVFPDAEEVISYGIPTFKQVRNLVHFGGYEKHIGFYPGAAAIKAFSEKIVGYKSAKGSVQFPLNEALPLELVTEICRYRLKLEKEKKAKNSKR